MKLLVFAHIPPPHHGQSYGVQRMIKGFGGDWRQRRDPSRVEPGDEFGIQCYHVNARFSRDLVDIGKFRGTKIFLVGFYALQAIWCRFRYGVENFYYVPAPGKKAAFYRDWLVLLLCRPFFKRTILHWHAAGLAKWLEGSVSMAARSFTYQRMGNADLSIVLSDFNRRDAEKLTSKRIVIVPAGVPDTCPNFDSEVLPYRRQRIAAFKDATTGTTGTALVVNVLFLAHCTREKGVFDAVQGVALANEKCRAENLALRFHLTLVGAFMSAAEEAELKNLTRELNLQDTVTCLGFVSEERKRQAWLEADIFCFPTYYLAESFGAVLVEAMSFGLPVITTRWRSIPELFPADYPGFVEPKSPAQIAGRLHEFTGMDLAAAMRKIFLRRYTFAIHLAGMAAAIRTVEPEK